MLKKLSAPLACGILALSLPGAASAAATICTTPSCVSPKNNVLFNTSTTGTIVTGSLNKSSAMVAFTGNEDLTTTASNGQARISGSDKNLTFLTFGLVGGQTFNEFEFNLNALASGTVTITLLGAGNTTLVSNSFAISPNGQNFFGGFGAPITGVQIASTVQLGDVRQVRLSGVAAAVPEPSSWAMMLLGFGALGASMRFRRRRTWVGQMA